MRLRLTIALLPAALLACAHPCATPESEEVLARAAEEEGAVRTESGLVFRLLQPGSGPRPDEDNRVQVHYEGRLADGTVFDSSIKRGYPAAFNLSDVVPGWREGLLMLEGGGKAKLTIPAELGYGTKGKRGKVPPCAVLIFEVELLGISGRS